VALADRAASTTPARKQACTAVRGRSTEGDWQRQGRRQVADWICRWGMPTGYADVRVRSGPSFPFSAADSCNVQHDTWYATRNTTCVAYNAQRATRCAAYNARRHPASALPAASRRSISLRRAPPEWSSRRLRSTAKAPARWKSGDRPGVA
jgi:hypothetical protein